MQICRPPEILEQSASRVGGILRNWPAQWDHMNQVFQLFLMEARPDATSIFTFCLTVCNNHSRRRYPARSPVYLRIGLRRGRFSEIGCRSLLVHST